MKNTKEKLFPQPTKIGTRVYAYETCDNGNCESEFKTYDIVHMDSAGEEKILKKTSFRAKLGVSEKEILKREVNMITDIFDIGAEKGQQILKQGFKNLLK